MKALINRIFVLSAFMLILGACDDFLETSNPNDITADVFFENADQIEQSVNTLYNSIQDGTRGGGDQNTFGQNSPYS